MGTDGKGVCMNLLGVYSFVCRVLCRVLPRSSEEVVLKLRCPFEAEAPVLDRVLGVLVQLVLCSEGAVPPQPIRDMVLFGVLGFCGGE